MLIEAVRWWVDRMAELVPARLLSLRSGWANAVVVVPAQVPGAAASLLLRRDGQETPIGHFYPGTTDRSALSGRARERPILLRPAAGLLLEKPLTLPIAAERELRRVIGYEMNRLTPFEPNEVFWTWSVLRHDRSRGRLQVRLSLIPRAGLLPLLAALEQARLAPDALEALPATGGPPRLIPLQAEADAGTRRRRATWVLASGCGALALTAVLLPFVLQSFALATVADRIAAVQPQVTQVQTLRQRVAAESAGQDAIVNERRRLGDTLAVLAEVTDRLPDDTFLNDLSLRQRKLSITGQSAAAPKLIGTLAADPMFRNPGFAAPVTRNPTGRDVFSISAEVGP